ncbi:MAG: monovalent cation/H+ antiporter complex subunit F [Brachybacterium sp.]|nr:monovalent cation/H+ antiporter complex subunit F [Brachybacterium sp.]
MTFEMGLVIVGVIVALSTIAPIVRTITGPNILDRAAASDMIIVLVVMGFALYAATTGSEFALTAMLALTATGFLSTVVIARFVGRQEAAGPAPQKMRGENTSADTSSPGHEVVHEHVGSGQAPPIGHPEQPGANSTARVPEGTVEDRSVVPVQADDSPAVGGGIDAAENDLSGDEHQAQDPPEEPARARGRRARREEGEDR